MAISFEYYRLFYHVAHYGSITRAAHVLGSSQPNLTRAMNALEAQLGCRLLVRGRHGVTLTPEGERLFTHAEAAYRHLSLAEEELQSAREPESGRIALSVSDIALRELLLPILRDFHLRHPKIQIQMNNHTAAQSVQALHSGLAELAVITTPTHAAPPLAEFTLAAVQDILVAGPRFSALRGRPVTLAELADYPLISLGSGSATFAFLSGFFAAHNRPFSPDMEAATTDQVLPMVSHDLGLGFIPRHFAAEALEKGEVFQVSLVEEIPPRSICLVRDKTRPLSAAAAMLEKAIRAAAE